VFLEKWDNFQFSFLGQYSLTIIENGGDAKVKGIESNLDWAVAGGFVLSLNGQAIDARTTTNYCGSLDANGNPITNCATPQAVSGMNLPLSPKFKANAVARETFALANDWDANLQAAYVYQSQTSPDLRPATVAVVGMQPAYGLLDLDAGIQKDTVHVDLFISNATDKRAELTRFVQSASALQPYVIPAQPRTIGIKFGQKF
jgi:outer membrane receptor protein involved in Fe transport